MDRKDFVQYVENNYGIEPEYIFAKHPGFCVFRHVSNRKWFAAVMDVPRNKLGLKGSEPLDVVNLKCDPILIGSLRKEIGIFAFDPEKTFGQLRLCQAAEGKKRAGSVSGNFRKERKNHGDE